MKRKFVHLLIVIALSFGTYAQEKEKSPIRTEQELMPVFDEIWQKAIDSNKIPEFFIGRGMAEQKPRIVVSRRWRGAPLASTSSKGITFYQPFFGYQYLEKKLSLPAYDVQVFVIGHEIGHWQIGHVRNWEMDIFGEDWREMTVRQECEADVFSAEIIGKEKGLNILRKWERAVRQTKEERATYLLFAPFFGGRDIFYSILHRRNELQNPFGKYNRRNWLHGPAKAMALLVLEGKQQNCGK